MPRIDKPLEKGDVVFVTCGTCDTQCLPIDTRIVGMYQFTQCPSCNVVLKYRFNGFKKNGSLKKCNYIWGLNFQNNPKYIERCLVVETDDDGLCIAIKKPKYEKVTDL